MDNYQNYRNLGEYDGHLISDTEDLDFDPCLHEDHDEEYCPARRIVE